MAAHEALYPLILPEVPQCPYPTVDTAINRAAQEFCRDSRVWETSQAVTLVDGQQTYPLVVPSDADVVSVRRVTFRHIIIRPSHYATRLLERAESEGQPALYSLSGEDLTVFPIPNSSVVGEDMAVICHFAPRFNSASIPDVLTQKWAEGVAAGALSILKRMPSKPWTDYPGAGPAHQVFAREKAKARIEQEHGSVTGSLRVTPRKFGGWP